jgi:uncharacterized protein YukE
MQSGFESPEFTVETPALTGAGAAVRELAQELTAIRGSWAAVTDEPGDAFGYRELAAAYTGLQDAWFAELGVHIEVLDELGTGLTAAADGYQRADRDAGHRTGPR